VQDTDLKTKEKHGNLVNFRGVITGQEDFHLRYPENRSLGWKYVTAVSDDWVKNKEDWEANRKRREKEEQAKKNKEPEQKEDENKQPVRRRSKGSKGMRGERPRRNMSGTERIIRVNINRRIRRPRSRRSILRTRRMIRRIKRRMITRTRIRVKTRNQNRTSCMRNTLLKKFHY